MGAAWQQTVAEHRSGIENAPTQDAFEQAVSDLLKTVGASHLGFFHGTGKRASSRAALSATYLQADTDYRRRWVFQDVHDGGAAHSAGIESGNILLRVNGKDLVPPEHPAFPMGSASTLEIVANDGTTRTVSAVVAQPKGKKLQFIEPTLVQARKLTPQIGYLKVAMFPAWIRRCSEPCLFWPLRTTRFCRRCPLQAGSSPSNTEADRLSAALSVRCVDRLAIAPRRTFP